jgi:ApaG protein
MMSMDDKDCDIHIHVATSYMDDQSEPEDDRYVFAYTITISNKGEEPATLLSRHWIITDANGKVQEVSGDGVVGEQPHLNPGERFRYSSGAVLETPVGAMQGLYRMQTDRGQSFDAPIQPFTLAVPGLLH